MPEDFPEYLEWNPSLAFPLAEESFGLNLESGFDTALLQLDTITGLPEWVSRLEVVMEGSIDFDLSVFTSRYNDLRSILFRVNLYNGFPNELHAQVYFLDPGLNPVDSLFSEGPVVVPPGTVLGNGETIEPYHVIRDAVFNLARIEKLEDASSLLFRAILRSPDVDINLIPYYPGYSFNVEIGAMAGLTFDFTF
ncbi:MAG: hypothetical protein KAT15_24700 [Bacteroidales bacterium]|nr:hypothetical protein [Bacteroidales bacterium]